MKKLFLYLFVVLLTASCKVDPKPPVVVEGLKEVVPAGWPKPVYTFSVNTISDAKFNLGKELFYEEMLSKDNTISCGTCHQQFVAFAHAEHDVSHGINDQVGTRNAPGIFNMNWHPYFMHDGGINHIEVQPLGPIENPIEMGEDIKNVISKLSASAKYRALFKEAYGDEEINTQKMFRSMAVFMGMLYSYNSKFDMYKRGENNVTLSDQEKRGYSLFQAKCNTCHTEPLFSDFKFRNNGISVNPNYNDSGRARITGLPSDKYTFKTPSLRNIMKTGPYMHDGRFSTLKECLDHYASPMANTVNLDPLLTSGIALTEQEKSDIIAFLNTLTDYEFLYDAKFADPNK